MRRGWLFGVGITILMLVPSSASATLVIDNFLDSSSDSAEFGTASNPASSNTTLTGLPFTTRTNALNILSGNPPPPSGSVASLQTSPCTGLATETCMAAAFDSSASGTFEVAYSGGGPIDLTQSGANNRIRIVTAFNDAFFVPVLVDVRITDSLGGDFTVADVPLPGPIDLGFTPLGITDINFNQFGGVDFTTVTGATFTFDTGGATARDYEFLLIGAAEIPEPTTFSLIGLGLLGLGVSAYRRRRLSHRS